MITLNTWHPINGKWVHIVQEDKGGTTNYYTDGELLAQEFVHDFANILKPVREPNRSLTMPDEPGKK